MYFPNNAQCDEKEREFYYLIREDLTVAEYVAKFIDLSRYALSFVDMEDQKKKWFFKGLKRSIFFGKMSYWESSTHEDVVKQAGMLEHFEKAARKETSDCDAYGSGGKSTRITGSSRSNRWTIHLL